MVWFKMLWAAAAAAISGALRPEWPLVAAAAAIRVAKADASTLHQRSQERELGNGDEKVPFCENTNGVDVAVIVRSWGEATEVEELRRGETVPLVGGKLC